MGHKVTKNYDNYKNDKQNAVLEKLYQKQQNKYKKGKRKEKVVS